MPTPRRKHVLFALAAGVALWLAWSWRDAGDAEERTEAGRAAAAPAARQLVNGRWVERDGSELLEALGKMPLPPGGVVRVTGEVRDYGSGAAIPGAEVVLANPLGESSAWTEDDGRYEIFVKPGRYRVFARADGYVSVGATPLERVPSTPDATEIGLPRGQIAPLLQVDRDRAGVDLELAGVAEVTGTVYDEAGRPVAGAVVLATRADGVRPIQGTHIDETDYDGSFRLIVPAGYATFDARHLDYAGVTGGGVGRYLDAGDQARVDLTLAAGCIIAGTVVDADGQRVSEGSLERWVGGAPPNDYRPAARIDADGDFRLALTESGRVRLRAWPWKAGPSQPKEFDCYDGATYADTLFVSQDVDADLEGTIYTARGEPLEHAFVDAIPLEPGGMAQQERADVYGEWAFYALPPGLYQVKAFVPGEGVAVALVEVPSRGIRLTLTGTGSIQGHARGVTDGALTLVVQTCTVAGEVDADFDDVTMPDIRMLVPVENGRFRVDGLPACQVTGHARHGNAVGRFAADVRAGGVASIDIELSGS